jgi:hypothetical protein
LVASLKASNKSSKYPRKMDKRVRHPQRVVVWTAQSRIKLQFFSAHGSRVIAAQTWDGWFVTE